MLRQQALSVQQILFFLHPPHPRLGVLVPQPGIEPPVPSAEGAES